MPNVGFASRPFAEQQAFFRRKVSISTRTWFDLQRSDHAHGFMVAGAHKLDLVEDFRKSIQEAIDSGVTLDDFKKNHFDRIVATHGWEYKGGRDWRARVIYETNLRQSYNAGRWAQLTSPEMVQVRPFLQYRHNDRGRSKTPRPMHQSWNLLVLRFDHPWWQTHAPMNGWGCNCGIRALSASDLRRMGKSGPDTAPNDGTYPWVAPDGTAHQVPIGIDPGFDSNPGAAARSLPAAQRFGERVMQMPRAWRQRALEDAGRRAFDFHADALPRIEAALAGRLTDSGGAAAVGMLRSELVDHLAARQALPTTATLAIADAELLALRGVDRLGDAAALLRDLPERLARPSAIYHHAAQNVAVYVYTAEAGALALRIDLDVVAGAAGRLNLVRQAETGDPGALLAAGFELVSGAP